MSIADIVVSFLVGTLGAGIASAVITRRFDHAFRETYERYWEELYSPRRSPGA